MELFVYIKLLAGEHTQEAKTSERKGGRNETVVWNEKITFTIPQKIISQDSRLYFEIRDSDLTNDDVVASGFANLVGGGFLEVNTQQSYSINVYFDKKPAGVLDIKTLYTK